MGSFRVKDAVSKRRPRQNIISLILKNAKKQGGAGGSTAGSSRCSASSDAGQSAATGATGPSARGGRARKKTGRLLASAVELTKRTRRVTSGPSSARGGGRRGSRRGGALVRGQKCFYRSSRGISKVTVVGVHHDSKLEPYYTIRLRDGKEKQADGKHLTPVVQEAGVAGAAAASKPAELLDEEDVEEIVYEDDDEDDDGENDGVDATTIEEEGQGVPRHPLLGKGEASNASSAQPRPPSLNATEATADHMTESSSEVEDGDDRGGRPRHPRSPRPLRGGSNHDDDGNDGDMEESDAPPHGRRGSAADADDSENARGSDGGGGGGRFYVDQDAYYRTGDGAVLKIRILAKPGSGGRYLVSLPDGSTESVRPERLATLMELSSQELARLMKEKNRRRGEGGGGGSANRDETDESGNEAPASRHHQRTHRGKRAARRGSGRRPTLDDGYMAGEDDGVGESSHESSSGRHGRGAQSKADDKANKKKAAAGDGSPLLALSCPFRMVEAKTEEGGTKTVPLYDKGIDVYYKNFAGIQPAHILSNHLDDLLDPYYSIRLEDGREKQTDNAHIRLTAKEFETKEANLDEKANENGGADEGAIVPVGQKKRGSDASSSADATSSSNKDASLTEYKKQYEALVMDGSDRGVDTTTSTLASSSMAASTSQALTPAPSRELAAPAHKYAVGDDVLYCSSQGESSTVAVTRLNLDKKGRPYYVVRLPGGKEKQVYGHRLKPLRIEPEAAEEGKDGGGRQRRSRSRSAAPSSRGRSRSLASGLRRSAPKRSDSVSSRTSNGSSQVSGGNKSSRGRRESAVRDPEPSATSDSRTGGRRRSSSRARGRSKSVAAGGRASRSRSTAGRRERSTSRPPEEGAGAERRPRAKRGAVGVSSSSRKVVEGGDGVGGGGSSRLSSIRKSFVGMSRSKH